MGIITEVVVQGVPRFNVEQQVEMRDFTKFLSLVKKHDPDGKFANEFSRQLFEP